MERYYGNASCAVGTAKALINLFRAAAAPTSRAKILEIVLGCSQAPADAATKFRVLRTTAVGTENDGFTPVNIDPAGPASASDFGRGAYSAEPTKTASSDLLVLPMNQRATLRWIASPGCEIMLPATQNYGACVESASSTVTTAHDVCVLFAE